MAEREIQRAVDAGIGANLRAARRDRRISQAAVANAVGVTRQQVQKYETGRDRVSLSMAVLLCRALDSPLETLLRGVWAPHAQPDASGIERRRDHG